MPPRGSRNQPGLFGPGDQLDLPEAAPARGKVEALGQQFDSDQDRRSHFQARLQELLRDPEFRRQPGFPLGDDQAILAMSDPPWYTACPNPFLEEYVRIYGRPYDPHDGYRREPFNSDTAEGKTHPVYTAHSYHTKVPHLAIVPYILHYTQPGDLVLDGFCGSGMTGVAAQWCGSAPLDYRHQLELKWQQEGRGKPKWGARRAILNDLSPAATFIAANYNLPFSVAEFARAARRILDEVEREIGWMYQTRHTDGRTGRINYTVWSEVFACGACGGEVVFLEEALDPVTKRVSAVFPCPHCRVDLTKGRGGGDDGTDEDEEGGSGRARKGTAAVRLERLFETLVDPADGRPWKRIKLRPAFLNYQVGKERFEKRLDAQDRQILERIEALPLPPEVPTLELPIQDMYHGSRLAPKGFTRVHHLFLPRAAQALGLMWRKARAHQDPRVRNMLLWWVEQAVWGLSVMARYAPTHFSQVNRYMTGVFYVGSQIVDCHPDYVLGGKLTRLQSTFSSNPTRAGYAALTVGTCAHLPAPDASIDYIFTDPPFGKNIFYADLNLLVEAWHGVRTQTGPEAVEDAFKGKDLRAYQELMRQGFAEYYRVLKPGRWMTVVFHNSSNLVWNAIQEALGQAGFVVAEVRTLDKKQGSYRQVTSSAMKTDLVVSAYRPTGRVQQALGTDKGPWTFLREYLGMLSPAVFLKGELQGQLERTPQRLWDQLVAWYFLNRAPIPMAAAEFFQGLEERFPERDGMHFLPEQLPEYERARSQVSQPVEIPLFIRDEKSAIAWVRAQLHERPRRLQDLTTEFLKATQWDRTEKGVELRDVLDQTFLQYDGNGPVPAQVQQALARQEPDLRHLDRENPRLKERARELWYVPDPTRAEQMEQRRRKMLVAEFQSYRQQKGRRLKEYRGEAIRAGFLDAYERHDYQAIIEVADRLPESVFEEDFELYMYLSNARTQLGQ